MDAKSVPNLCYGSDLLHDAGFIQGNDLLTDDDAGKGETLILHKDVGRHRLLAQIAGNGQHGDSLGKLIIVIIADDYHGTLAIGDIGFFARIRAGNISPENIILLHTSKPPAYAIAAIANLAFCVKQP